MPSCARLLLRPQVAITDLKFGKEFTAAIESKQVAEQDAERARFLVMKAEQEKRAAVIRAEGESESAALVSEALQDVRPHRRFGPFRRPLPARARPLLGPCLPPPSARAGCWAGPATVTCGRYVTAM